jgi:hypothetical protein
VKWELPIKFRNTFSPNPNAPLGFFELRGESYNDYQISILYNEEINVSPLTTNGSYIQRTRKGIIEQKIFLNNEPVYILKVFVNKERTVHKHFMLIAKKRGLTHSADNAPIASLNSLNSEKDNALVFHEWVVLRVSK